MITIEYSSLSREVKDFLDTIDISEETTEIRDRGGTVVYISPEGSPTWAVIARQEDRRYGWNRE